MIINVQCTGFSRAITYVTPRLDRFVCAQAGDAHSRSREGMIYSIHSASNVCLFWASFICCTFVLRFHGHLFHVLSFSCLWSYLNAAFQRYSRFFCAHDPTPYSTLILGCSRCARSPISYQSEQVP